MDDSAGDIGDFIHVLENLVFSLETTKVAYVVTPFIRFILSSMCCRVLKPENFSMAIDAWEFLRDRNESKNGILQPIINPKILNK